MDQFLMMNDQIKYIAMVNPDRCQSKTTNNICTLILIGKDVHFSDLILQNRENKMSNLCRFS